VKDYGKQLGFKVGKNIILLNGKLNLEPQFVTLKKLHMNIKNSF
jgi:hypothetical protein